MHHLTHAVAYIWTNSVSSDGVLCFIHLKVHCEPPGGDAHIKGSLCQGSHNLLVTPFLLEQTESNIRQLYTDLLVYAIVFVCVEHFHFYNVSYIL